MGNTIGKIIEIKNIQQSARQCQELATINCEVYGQIHLVRYNNLEFYLKETKTNQPPAATSLHYLIPSKFFVIPKFTLLENASPSSIEDIIELIQGVSELGSQNVLGVGRRRLGFAGKWGVVGEASPDWGYHQIMKSRSSNGIYLSPQQMISLSHKNQLPKHNTQKSDIFAFGIMLIELIFKENMGIIYDYCNFEIKLKPLLSRLNIIKQQFGQSFYEILLSMLQFEEEERTTFKKLLLKAQSMSKSSQKIHTSHIRSTNKSPIKRRGVVAQRSEEISFIGKIPERIQTNQRSYKSPDNERINSISPTKSPMKRDLRIGLRTDKQNTSHNPLSKSPFKIQHVMGSKRGLTPLTRR